MKLINVLNGYCSKDDLFQHSKSSVKIHNDNKDTLAYRSPRGKPVSDKFSKVHSNVPTF